MKIWQNPRLNVFRNITHKNSAMKVRVKIDKLLKSKENFTEFLISGQKVAFSNSEFKPGKRNSIIVEHKLASKNNLRWKLLFHFPPYILPVPNQKSINELKFTAEECG